MKIIEKKYYPWVVVALLWVVALLNYMDRQMLSTMQTSMKADIHELNQAEFSCGFMVLCRLLQAWWPTK